MTRAKEKLIMIATHNKTPAFIRKCAIDINGSETKITPYAVTKAGSYGSWLVTCLLRHPDSLDLRRMADIPTSVVLDCSSPLKVVYKECTDERDVGDIVSCDETEADDNVFREISEKLSGVTCGFKSTSCPDQLALALSQYKAEEGE
jgi:hypothetical protein